MKSTACVEYDKCYEFYDKQAYEEKLTQLYMLTDTYSAKSLAVHLNEPEAAVQKAIEQMVIPTEWLMKAFFIHYETIQSLLSDGNFYKNEHFKNRYEQFKNSHTASTLEKCLDAVSYAVLKDDAVLSDPKYIQECEEIMIQLKDIVESGSNIH